MKSGCLLVLVACGAALLCSASTTNTVSAVAAATSTNAPAAKLPRTQCVATTKSGTRCKRNAVPGHKLCRQHQKIKQSNMGK